MQAKKTTIRDKKMTKLKTKGKGKTEKNDDGGNGKNKTPRLFTLDMESLQLPKVEFVDVPTQVMKPTPSPIKTMHPPRLPSQLRKSGANTRTSEIYQLISQLTTYNPPEMMEALSQVTQKVFLRKDEAIVPYIKNIVLTLAAQIHFLFVSKPPETSRRSKSAKSDLSSDSQLAAKIFDTLIAIYNETHLVDTLDLSSTQHLLQESLIFLVSKQIKILDTQDSLCKQINILILKILENTHKNIMYASIIRTLRLLLSSPYSELGLSNLQSPPMFENQRDESQSNRKSQKRAKDLNQKTEFTILLLKCLFYLVRNLPRNINHLNLDSLMFEIHLFLNTHPVHINPRSKKWKYENDFSLRAIKTLLVEIINIKKSDVLNHLTKIPLDSNPVIVSYIKMILKSSNLDVDFDEKDDFKTPTKYPKSKAQNTSDETIPDEVSTQLDQILSKVVDPQKSTQAFTDLHQFSVKNPSVDIQQKLTKFPETIRGYISRGLSLRNSEHKHRVLGLKTSDDLRKNLNQLKFLLDQKKKSQQVRQPRKFNLKEQFSIAGLRDRLDALKKRSNK
eukprot:Anaeramoba_ignava/c21734_g1_i1.p2 GENE.c21734_g1_i1~~c21734_g1_i1.p2  ORF type:complete len:560 (-),score=135.17 c21734_g1_i1:87-1766(-)